MDTTKVVQLLLVAGLLGITFAMFFVVIPPQNLDMFKMCVVSIISFISGAAAGKLFAGETKKEEKKGEGP